MWKANIFSGDWTEPLVTIRGAAFNTLQHSAVVVPKLLLDLFQK